MRYCDKLFFFVGLLLIAAAAREALAAAPTCVANGYETQFGGVTTYTMQCTGQCPTSPPTNCPTSPPGTGTLPGGQKYKFCMCPGGAEATCCHLILLVDGTGTGTGWGTKGSCPACPTTGECKVKGDGTAVDPKEAVCERPPA